jgi:hypothetical protein
MQFSMIARIDFSENHNNKVYTVVTTPAPDAFSHPSRFKVVSEQPLGAPGQSIDMTLSVGGVVREKQYRDKQTGYNKTFYEADVYLNVVNSKPYIQPQQQQQKAANAG